MAENPPASSSSPATRPRQISPRRLHSPCRRLLGPPAGDNQVWITQTSWDLHPHIPRELYSPARSARRPMAKTSHRGKTNHAATMPRNSLLESSGLAVPHHTGAARDLRRIRFPHNDQFNRDKAHWQSFEIAGAPQSPDDRLAEIETPRRVSRHRPRPMGHRRQTQPAK